MADPEKDKQVIPAEVIDLSLLPPDPIRRSTAEEVRAIRRAEPAPRVKGGIRITWKDLRGLRRPY